MVKGLQKTYYMLAKYPWVQLPYTRIFPDVIVYINNRALEDKFCQKISVQYVKYILCDECLKTWICTANVWLIDDFATQLLKNWT